jgi:hypothetical protein
MDDDDPIIPRRRRKRFDGFELATETFAQGDLSLVEQPLHRAIGGNDEEKVDRLF